MSDKKMKKQLAGVLKKESNNQLVPVRSGSGLKMRSGPQGFFISSKRKGSGKSHVPWEPIFTTGETEGQWLVQFSIGNVNNVVPSNWDEIHDLGVIEDKFKWVLLTVTTVGGIVTGCVISIADTPPQEDEVNEGTPPASHVIVLGVVGNSRKYMMYSTNLNMIAYVVFVTTRQAEPGQEPFSRWWRWNHYAQ